MDGQSQTNTMEVYRGAGVEYVLPDGPNAGEIRPAIVTGVHDTETGCANLTVFADQPGDARIMNCALRVIETPWGPRSTPVNRQ